MFKTSSKLWTYNNYFVEGITFCFISKLDKIKVRQIKVSFNASFYLHILMGKSNICQTFPCQINQMFAKLCSLKMQFQSHCISQNFKKNLNSHALILSCLLVHMFLYRYSPCKLGPKTARLNTIKVHIRAFLYQNFPFLPHCRQSIKSMRDKIRGTLNKIRIYFWLLLEINWCIKFLLSYV